MASSSPTRRHFYPTDDPANQGESPSRPGGEIDYLRLPYGHCGRGGNYSEAELDGWRLGQLSAPATARCSWALLILERPSIPNSLASL